jgi:hypothetical protein
MLLMAVDPATGNSAMHAAVAADNLDAVRGIRDKFVPWVRQLRRPYHMLVSHKNGVGDTALHIAARRGNLELVTAMYRLFRRDWLPGEKRFAYRDVGDVDVDYVPPLGFVLDKNSAGRDAVAEARAAGRGDVAQRLETVVARLDPERGRMDVAEMEHMVQFVRLSYINTTTISQTMLSALLTRIKIRALMHASSSGLSISLLWLLIIGNMYVCMTTATDLLCILRRVQAECPTFSLTNIKSALGGESRIELDTVAINGRCVQGVVICYGYCDIRLRIGDGGCYVKLQHSENTIYLPVRRISGSLAENEMKRFVEESCSGRQHVLKPLCTDGCLAVLDPQLDYHSFIPCQSQLWLEAK